MGTRKAADSMLHWWQHQSQAARGVLTPPLGHPAAGLTLLQASRGAHGLGASLTA